MVYKVGYNLVYSFIYINQYNCYFVWYYWLDTKTQVNSPWYTEGLKLLDQKLNDKPIKKAGNSVILFLGDGMSLTTVTAARIFKGQREGKFGEEGQLSWESYPHTGLAKTYNIDYQVSLW